MSEADNRQRLTDPYPEWEAKYVEQKVNPPVPSFPVRMFHAVENVLDRWTHPRSIETLDEILQCLDQIVDVDRIGRNAAVIGCGPRPASIAELAGRGYAVVGVEPVAEGVVKAQAFLAGKAEVVQGTAEDMRIESNSQSLVLMETVLEHVDSVRASLSETYRVLRPGGVLLVRTTNRHRFSVTGINWEFKSRFFNWFPPLLKESYVFDQLHYRPELAHYSPRPAVHWLSFSELCEAGRDVGFARFYSPYDLMYLARRQALPAWRFRLCHWFHRNPWFRLIAISQMVGDIFMWKRAGF